MAKLTLTDLTNLENQSSAVTTINNNSAAIETALENTLSRDGTSPNAMEANLDMNSNRILNLPEPVDSTEPARFQDIEDLVERADEFDAALEQAEDYRDQAGVYSQLASESASQAQASAEEAAGQAEKLRSTSSTSNTIGTGSKVFTVDEDDYFTANMYVFIVDSANADNYMFGTVTDYTGDQLTVNVDVTGGSGTIDDWLITISGARGSVGPQGPQGNPGQDGKMDGPVTSVVDNIAVFDTTDGSSVDDSGVSINDVLVSSDIGTTVQAWAANLDSWSSANPTVYYTASETDSKISTAVSTATTNMLETTDIGVTVQGYDADTLKADVEDQGPITGGAGITPKNLGTITTGTVSIDLRDRPMQRYTNNGAHTLDVTANAGTGVLLIVNGASAGAITTTGFTHRRGPAFTTTNGHVFRCTVEYWDSSNHYLFVEAMQ